MLRMSLLAAVAAGLAATPSFAAEPATEADAPSVKAYMAQLTWEANQQQLRKLLAHQGYVVTSELTRTENGLIVGTALKDGKPVTIGVRIPVNPQPESQTN